MPWTQNLYAYVGNNPVNYVDPTGHNSVAASKTATISLVPVFLVSMLVILLSPITTIVKLSPDEQPPKDECDKKNDPSVKHFDNFDDALRAARDQAGLRPDESVLQLFDPETGTLVAERALDGKRGWRIDDGHVNGYDWTDGKRGKGGTNTHNCFPESQNGPQSPPPSQHTPSDWQRYDPPTPGMPNTQF